MFEIIVMFADGQKRSFKGNFVLEGSFVRINYDHDDSAKTPQRTVVYPAHMISSINCIVIQSGISTGKK